MFTSSFQALGKGICLGPVPALTDHPFREATEIITNYITCQVVFRARERNREEGKDAILDMLLRDVSSNKAIFE